MLPYICPDCGANLPENETCQSIFESFLALEYSQPAYGQVHFLTVACYMIQHGRYSDEALRWIEPRLRSFVEGSSLSEMDLREMSRDANSKDRRWKVNRQPGEGKLAKIAWTVTIADVARQYTDAASYRKLVKEWAQATLAEMQPWLLAG